MRRFCTGSVFFSAEKKTVKPVLVFNAVFAAAAAASTAAVYIVPKNEAAAAVFKVFVFTVFQILVLAAGRYFCGGERPAARLFPDFCKNRLPQGLLFSGLTLMLFIVCRAVFRIGLQAENAAGAVLALAALTLFFFCGFSLFWFVAVFSADDAAFVPCIKRSILLFLQFPLFTCGLFFAGILYALLSCLTLFLFPGPAGIVLNVCSAYKRLKAAV